jgi:outer membrane protein assembly factor BamB
MNLLHCFEIGSPVYASPVFSDGGSSFLVVAHSRIVASYNLSSFTMEYGFPVMFEPSQFHARPLLYDLDADGLREVLLATYDGEIVAIRGDGSPLYGKAFKVPALSVPKKWYSGLLEDSEFSFEDAGVIPNKSSHDETAPSASSDSKREKPMVQLDEATMARLTEEARTSIKALSSLRFDESVTEVDDIYYAPVFEANEAVRKPVYKEEVRVDAHILSTPVTGDVDGDGCDELVVAVSYYFDPSEFDSHVRKWGQIESDVDVENYVAGGLVVFDLATQMIKYSVQLDLTTTHATLKALIYSSPQIADVNGDGHRDIIIATAAGFVYVLDGRTGASLEGFPVAMADIHGDVIVADVNDDGALEICAADGNANIACFNHLGQELWDTRVSGAVSASPLLVYDNTILVSTLNGHIWAFDGATGRVRDGYPIKVGSNQAKRGFAADQVAVGDILFAPTLDGRLYTVNLATLAVSHVDVGEEMQSAVAIADVDEDGYVEVLSSTMSGNVYMFSTNVARERLPAYQPTVPRLLHLTQSDRSRTVIAAARTTFDFETVKEAVTVVIRLGRTDEGTLMRKTYKYAARRSEQVRFPEFMKKHTGVVHAEVMACNVHLQCQTEAIQIIFLSAEQQEASVNADTMWMHALLPLSLLAAALLPHILSTKRRTPPLAGP